MSAVDLSTATAELFAPHVGSAFAVRPEGQPELRLELTLTGASELPEATSADGARAPFALTFSGPPEQLLTQQIVPLEHAQLGRLEIFLVPLALDAGGARYEAVFS